MNSNGGGKQSFSSTEENLLTVKAHYLLASAYAKQEYASPPNLPFGGVD